MAAPHGTGPSAQSPRYRLTVAGRLDAAWADWFAGSITAQPGGTTVIEVVSIDQAMLYGLIARVRDLGLTLLSLQQVED